MIILVSFFAFLGYVSTSYAHCDTLDGPVVESARKALASGDVTPVLKWIAASDEEAIRSAFQKTMEVRSINTQARELADMYFFETLVRIHRANEGALYTGLKPGTEVDPAVALADKALASGSVDKLTDVLTEAMAKRIQELFQKTLEAQKHADESVGAGRQFVEHYVNFTHFAEKAHALIKGTAGGHSH
ncbi:MAG TPA: hypothetical protein ENN79_10005 [Desulfobacteraceae bacterium]|nr:hypothetical protein [Desulfobacteraceae bacterium]